VIGDRWPVIGGRWPVAGQDLLTVARAGTGTGSVTSAPDGITCGATCTASFPTGASVTLTATPGTGSTFAGWSGAAACVVTVDQARLVTATFTAAAPRWDLSMPLIRRPEATPAWPASAGYHRRHGLVAARPCLLITFRPW
jgi:hypothetical protein